MSVAIEGMHCDGCAETIKALLSLEAGVEAATVSWQEGRAHVSYDPAAVDPAKLVAAIERCGYKVKSTA
ncbi:MAG: heavy-metal-associated domain-containing protein [Betaproteobacteria bacterium]|nr:heavy-metal-associated domain-containing protein [Betaproteobacteria bacterium]